MIIKFNKKRNNNYFFCRKVYVLASDFETFHNLFVLDVTEQNWETYSIIWDNHMIGFGKMIALRENLYYFHDLKTDWK